MKREDNEEMRANILDAVISCKSDAVGGYVSLSQISFRAGISERTLSRYFPDKELMVYEAAVKYLSGRYDAFSRQYNEADKSGMNALERLLYLVRMQMENYKKDTVSALMFVRAYITTLNTSVYRKLPISGFDASAREIVLDCVKAGIRDGSMRKDIVPMDTYLLISSNFNGLVMRLIYMHSVEYSEEAHKAEILLVFNKYLRMLEEFLSASGREGLSAS